MEVNGIDLEALSTELYNIIAQKFNECGLDPTLMHHVLNSVVTRFDKMTIGQYASETVAYKSALSDMSKKMEELEDEFNNLQLNRSGDEDVKVAN